MKGIELYVNRLLKKTKLNKIEKKDLELELIEHLNNIKEDYIKKGIPEKEAINNVISNFNYSEFLEEINTFSTKKKLKGISFNYLILTSFILILSYMIATSICFTFFDNNRTSMILYFIIMGVISIVNFYFAYNNFESKKDIIINTLLGFLSFFFLRFIIIISFNVVYNLKFLNEGFNMFNSNLLNINTILIDFSILILSFIFIKFVKIDINEKNTTFSNLDFYILGFSLVLNLIYFLYPNRFNILKTIVYKLFHIDVYSFDKNIFFMNINNEINIINVGLIMLIIFMIYKLFFKKFIKNFSFSK